jgi:hypothetical protein
MSSRYVVPNYMKSTQSWRNKVSVRARYLDRKKIILKEVAKKAPDKNMASDGYPKDRRKVVEQLKECRWTLIELTDALDEQLIINAERSKLTPEKIPPKKVSMVEASRGAKTDDSAKDLQQWYTIDELAEECMEKFKTHCPDVWQDESVYYVEPSAGEGDILLKLPEGRRKGVDLEPKNDKLKATMETRKKSETDIIEKMNFFDTTRENLGVGPDQPLVLIGNPPFGDVASHFFDHATTKGLQGSMKPKDYKGPLNADYIAWILPNSFLSRGKRNKIDPHYHLIYVMNITCCYVHKDKLYNLATMFGIWKHEDIPLKIPQTVMGSSDFELITDKDEKFKIKEEGLDSRHEYFWMRKVVQHINTKPQAPTFNTAQELMDTYAKTRMKATELDKLLESFCIKCRTPELHKKVYEFFSKYNWAEHIGQFASGRSKKDWDPPTRIIISKTMLYSAYNNDFVFRPYEDATADATQAIKQEKSDITRASVEYKHGGRRKKRTKKKARKKRRKRSKRKYK